MPMNSVVLRPGVNTLLTLSANEAGVSESGLIRYQYQQIQKIGGWEQYWPIAIASTIKDLHGWQDIAGNKYLGVGATMSLEVISTSVQSDITPQVDTTNNAPNFSVSSGSNIVTVIDAGSSASIYSSIYLNTPVALGDLLLNGGYRINSIGGANTYTILSSNTAGVTVASSGVVPLFETSSGSAIIDVTLPNNNFAVIPGQFQQFIAPTNVGGLTIQGPYAVTAVLDSTQFQIGAVSQASSVASVYMNNGNAQIVYYNTVGPPEYLGYGGGGYGEGGYGTGSALPAPVGTPITADDWSLDNWGELFMACPEDGPVYIWSPSGGLANAQVLAEAPFFNGGLFISMPQQILVLWRSCQSTGVQDPLIVRWSDDSDYTQWTVNSQTSAGSFRIPTGSIIMGGLQAPTQGVIWTDIDVWVMQYVGQPLVFNFNRVGTGCGLVGQHAADVLGGDVYWMARSNFFVMSGTGVQPIPCSVWNFVFENIDTTNFSKVRCAANSLYNEITWFFPALGGSGENTLYVKYNTLEKEWDYGTLGRSAWIDVTVLGNPIGSALDGTIYQHELGENDGTAAISSFFESGYWSIADGNQLSFVDWVIPDMQFGTYAGAKTAVLNVTFLAVDYPGQTPREYGPYPYVQGTPYINTRLRGRLMAIRVESDDLDSFWRLGRVRYRWAPAGRR